MTSGTKEEFKRYRKICESIDILKKEIRQIEAASEVVGDTYRDYRSGAGVIKKISGLVDVQKKSVRLKELEERRAHILLSINSIADDLTRDVVKKRYIDGMTWQQIAKAEGHPEKADYYRLVIHDKFFRNKKIQ